MRGYVQLTLEALRLELGTNRWASVCELCLPSRIGYQWSWSGTAALPVSSLAGDIAVVDGMFYKGESKTKGVGERRA